MVHSSKRSNSIRSNSNRASTPKRRDSDIFQLFAGPWMREPLQQKKRSSGSNNNNNHISVIETNNKPAMKDPSPSVTSAVSATHQPHDVEEGLGTVSPLSSQESPVDSGKVIETRSSLITAATTDTSYSGVQAETAEAPRHTLDEIESHNHASNHAGRHKFDADICRRQSVAVSEFRKSHEVESIEDQEIYVRENFSENNFRESWHSVYSSLKVIFVFLLTKETYITMLLAMASTCYFYFMHRENDDFDGGGIPFVLLGVAVVIPTINLITMEYTRRETALRRIGELRAVWLRLFQLHCFMNWDKGQGRKNDPLGLEHADDVADNILGACDELMRFLTLPSSTNTQNYLTRTGQKKAAHILGVAEPLFESCTARRGARFTALAEKLKASGASQTEMSRMEQFHRDMQAQYEHLRYVKMYRTPQALRSLARVTTIMMLPLFGPSYAQLAINIGSLFLGLMLTGVSAIILSGLYEAARVVEDPFNAFVVMDGINVRDEMDSLFRQIVAVREEAFKEEARENPYEIPASKCMTSSTLFTYFNSDGFDREETTFRSGGLDSTKTTEKIMEATPNQKNRRKRFGPVPPT